MHIVVAVSLMFLGAPTAAADSNEPAARPSAVSPVPAQVWGACGTNTPEDKVVATYSKGTLRCGNAGAGYRHIQNRHMAEWQGLADIEGRNWRDIADMAIAKSMDSPDKHGPAGRQGARHDRQDGTTDGYRTSSPRILGVAVVNEPTVADLVQSLIGAGRDWRAEVVVRDGVLWLDRLDDQPVCPAVEFRITDEELLAYYRRTADGQFTDLAQSPFDWWRDLVSTHFSEALYDLDRLGGPCVISIGDSGLFATRADTASHPADGG